MPGPLDRPAEGPDSPTRPDRPAAADGRARPREDLDERLRQLPPGHPSSLERTAAEPVTCCYPPLTLGGGFPVTISMPPASRTQPGGTTGTRCQACCEHGQRTSPRGLLSARRARSTGQGIRPVRGAVTAISTWTRNSTLRPRMSSPTSGEPRSPSPTTCRKSNDSAHAADA
jgi:hypothetical protein